jgi:hypothetical protein
MWEGQSAGAVSGRGAPSGMNGVFGFIAQHSVSSEHLVSAQCAAF